MYLYVVYTAGPGEPWRLMRGVRGPLNSARSTLASRSLAVSHVSTHCPSLSSPTRVQSCDIANRGTAQSQKSRLVERKRDAGVVKATSKCLVRPSSFLEPPARLAGLGLRTRHLDVGALNGCALNGCALRGSL